MFLGRCSTRRGMHAPNNWVESSEPALLIHSWHVFFFAGISRNRLEERFSLPPPRPENIQWLMDTCRFRTENQHQQEAVGVGTDKYSKNRRKLALLHSGRVVVSGELPALVQMISAVITCRTPTLEAPRIELAINNNKMRHSTHSRGLWLSTGRL